MKVSIIIPVYNVSKYIERCIKSVTNQTYTNIECILVDDCSTDNSYTISQDFINDYKGDIAFTLLHHDKNKGQAAARNTGLREAKGEYVFFLDSDDAITPECIEEQMKVLKKYKDADFVQANFLDGEGNISQYGWNYDLKEYCNKHEELEKLILFTVVTSACNKIIKKSVFTEHNLIFPEGIVHEDMYWSFYLAKYTKAAAYINKGTYIYYINIDSTMTSISKKARIRRYTSRLFSSTAFCAELDKEKKASKYQRLFIAGNLTSAMIEVAALHSFHHWIIFWKHVGKLYSTHKHLTIWQHILFFFMMPPLCFPIGIKGWYWRVQQYIVNKI